MVNTVKFSEFDAITLNGSNTLVGLSDGVNAISDLPINWTTAGRPVSPTDGFSGYNTSLSQWEFWNAGNATWDPIGGGGAGTVTEVDTGTGLTGGPITASGTISFAPIAANSFWANTTGGAAVPTVTSLSNFLLASNNLSDLPSKPTARTNLGVAIGVNVQAWSSILDQIAANTWLGSTSITTLGTITTGVWNGSTIQVPRGGTGNTTFTAYSVLCAGTTATGPFQNVSGLGTAGQVLTSNGAGGLPTWQSTTGSGTVNPGLINQVAYYPANGTAVSGITTGNDGVLITSAGGVPSISSTLPSLVQTNITQLGTIVTGVWEGTNIALDHGGTNASLVASNGGIFYSTATAAAILLGTVTANQILMSGSSSAPAWSTATYPATTTINRILYSSAANTISEIASLANGVLITGGTGIPAIATTLPSTVQLNITQLGTIVTGVWNGTTIAVPNGGTGNTTFTAYSVICAGTTATGPFQNVSGVGSSGQVLTSNGAAALPTWQNVSGTGTVNSGNANDLAYYATTGNTISALPSANGGVLVTSNTGVPSILAGSGTTGTIFQATAGGTPAWSTATYPATTTINQILYSSAANVVAGLATANSGVLVTSSTGVPSILAAGTTGQVLQASTAGTPAWSTATYPSTAGTSGNVLTSDGTNFVSSTLQSALLCTGRLTLTTGVPVTTADVTAATTVYFTPYSGNQISLFDGSATWVTRTLTEISIAVPGTTNTMYDVFCYDNAGTPTLELTAWTNDTTRATALAFQNGVYVKSGTTTRRYLGSFRTTGVSGQTEDSFAKRYVWNYYNRVARPMSRVDTTNTWNYSSTTFQQANANAANQLDMVIGVAEDEVHAQALGDYGSSGATFRLGAIGIGVDSTTVNSGQIYISSPANSGTAGLCHVIYEGIVAAGRHTLVWLEKGAGADTQIWQGDSGSTFIQTGISGFLRG